ncbi:hypothetical protein NPIL_56631 [Nephila pilipes]|uniref:Uncharacterized protein n=1 Tax=Nephila pilipes TaxID=299642 RepID=A0A8X6PSJ4_NEPPI|nr:hypothetical protein NPIL_56631 [Nephila pilipes]
MVIRRITRLSVDRQLEVQVNCMNRLRALQPISETWDLSRQQSRMKPLLKLQEKIEFSTDRHDNDNTHDVKHNDVLFDKNSKNAGDRNVDSTNDIYKAFSFHDHIEKFVDKRENESNVLNSYEDIEKVNELHAVNNMHDSGDRNVDSTNDIYKAFSFHDHIEKFVDKRENESNVLNSYEDIEKVNELHAVNNMHEIAKKSNPSLWGLSPDQKV